VSQLPIAMQSRNARHSAAGRRLFAPNDAPNRFRAAFDQAASRALLGPYLAAIPWLIRAERARDRDSTREMIPPEVWWWRLTTKSNSLSSLKTSSLNSFIPSCCAYAYLPRNNGPASIYLFLFASNLRLPSSTKPILVSPPPPPNRRRKILVTTYSVPRVFGDKSTPSCSAAANCL
jgi:hypothetical protein